MPDDPFADIGQLFEQLGQFEGAPGAIPVDIRETADAVILDADLPGRAAEDIDVRVRNGRELRIEAEPGTREFSGEYVRRERPGDPITRTLTLPTVVAETEADASYDRGVLTVELPKSGGTGTEITVE